MIKQRSNLILPVSLYAIGGSKDVLNLHTGELTHRIGKIVFDGTENWSHTTLSYGYCYVLLNDTSFPISNSFCSHFKNSGYTGSSRSEGRASLGNEEFICIRSYPDMNFRYDSVSNTNEFKAYLAAQYAAGTPVTVWYILGTPTTEIVTVPEGLSGIVEGYLIQDGTPTPQNPIYPTSCDSVDMWNEVMYRQYGVNETLSPIPTTVFSQGDGIDSCTVYGNTVQNGTPAPTVPVDVNGVGDVTNNLVESYITSCNIQSNGTLIGNPDFNMFIAKVEQGKAYCADTSILGGYFTSKPTMGSVSYNGGRTSFDPSPFIAPIDGYLAFRKGSSSTSAMMNEGDELLPYEPYGHVVPIEVDNTKITVPLNTTQSIRRIKKIVLTGNEGFNKNGGDGNYLFYSTNRNAILPGYLSSTRVICDRLPYSTAAPVHVIGINSINPYDVLYLNFGADIMNAQPSGNTVAGLKEYLTAQYNAGTPVTIYYVLATPQTTTLNEPLMKIGDYADSVTYSSNIPTTYGQNDITTDTQIKPSKLDITYNALRRAKVYKNNRWILNPSIDWSQTLKISDLQSKKIKEMEGEYIGYNIHT